MDDDNSLKMERNSSWRGKRLLVSCAARLNSTQVISLERMGARTRASSRGNFRCTAIAYECAGRARASPAPNVLARILNSSRTSGAAHATFPSSSRESLRRCGSSSSSPSSPHALRAPEVALEIILQPTSKHSLAAPIAHDLWQML